MARCYCRYRGYEFAYVIESDVRLPGSHWGKFLVAALHQGIKAEDSDANRADGVKFDTSISAELPSSLEDVPDLLAFGRIWPSTQWLSSQVGLNFNGSQLEEMRAMSYGELRTPKKKGASCRYAQSPL